MGRVRKRRKVDEAGSEVVPAHMTIAHGGNNAATYDSVTSDLEYSRQYSNPLFPRTQSGVVLGEPPRTYQGETTVGGSAILVQGDITHNHYHLQGPQQDKYNTLHESLTFDRMDARRRNIATPLTDTCQWLFKHKLFCRWIDKSHTPEHHGFFWIKGKPGSGKSTIMKEIVTWAQKTWESQIVLTYFFNARSPQYLEKSTLGLYRSLLHQLLSAHPEGHLLFVDRFAAKIRAGKVVEEWSHIELQNFLIELITKTNTPNVNIIIDALDEGDTNDIRQMITFLEQLTRSSFSAKMLTRVCFSSRHYPHISVRKGLSLVLEEQASHTTDIDDYIRNELASHDNPQMDKLRQEVRDRSAGIFLWVVLVIPILNTGFDRGKSVATMREELRQIPQDLRNMFVEILSRDTEDLDECMSLLRWTLFSQRPLSSAEAYAAAKLACSSVDTTEDTDLCNSTRTKYLLHCSRGLIELIDDKSDWRTVVMSEFESRKLVQFIHETVREFLLGERGLEWTPGASNLRLDARPDSRPDLRFDTRHGAMAEDCMRYIVSLSRKRPLTKELLVQHLLADYAFQHWYVHLQICSTQPSQTMIDLASEILIGEHDIHPLEQVRIDHLGDSEPELCHIARPLRRAVLIGLPQLVSSVLSHDVVLDNTSVDSALILAASRDSKDVLQTLIDHGANINGRNYRHETALLTAADHSSAEIVQVLLEHGADVHDQDRYGTTPLHSAVARADEEIVRMILEYGADVNAQNSYGTTALHRAAERADKEIVRVILEHGADINIQDRNGETALCRAAGFERYETQILLADEVDLDDRARNGVFVSYGATDGRSENVVQTLLEHGADANIPTKEGHTPLLWAAATGRMQIVQLLLDHKADPNAILRYRIFVRQALQAAVIGRHEEVVRLLLEHNANIHVPLIYQSYDGQWKVLTLLQYVTSPDPIFDWENFGTAHELKAKDKHIAQTLRSHGAPETFSCEEEKRFLEEYQALPSLADLQGTKVLVKTEHPTSYFELS